MEPIQAGSSSEKLQSLVTESKCLCPPFDQEACLRILGVGHKPHFAASPPPTLPMDKTLPVKEPPLLILPMDKTLPAKEFPPFVWLTDNTSPTEEPPPTRKDILSKFLKQELAVDRLEKIHERLWLAGRAGNIRPLHKQKILGREIVITEDTNLHLVWDEARIFIKPLPKFLLDYRFFKQNLCSDEAQYGRACGLLFSYTKLILHKSDFIIAIEMNLLPSVLKDKYDDWCGFVETVQSNIHHDLMDRRYIYGELRMTRLNLIYRLLGYGTRGFHSNYTRYGFFFQKNFGGLLIAFGYISLVLAAMQTVLTSQFGESQYMKGASYGFGVFSYVTIMVVLGVVLLIFLMFVVLFVSNLLVTLKHDRKRKHEKAKADLESGGGSKIS